MVVLLILFWVLTGSNGSADVTYDNQTYRIICNSCGNIAEVKLLIKETNIDKPTNATKLL